MVRDRSNIILNSGVVAGTTPLFFYDITVYFQ